MFVNGGEPANLYGGGEILTHEIAVLLNDIGDAGNIRDKLSRKYGDNSVRTWKELAPDAAMMNDFMIMYYFIFIGIIMLALTFGIINTMLMAILERTKELGMLMAIGMNRRRIFLMIMLETVFLTVVGAVAGKTYSEMIGKDEGIVDMSWKGINMVFLRVKYSFWNFSTFAASTETFMALVHELERSGNWLFKRRSWLPLFLVAAGILMMYLGNRQAIFFDLRDEMIFLGVSLLGELVRILTVGFAPKGTSGRNTGDGQIAWELNVTGAYSLLRHPLYLGNFLMWLGPVLFLRSVWFTILFSLIYWLYYERIMFAEEQFLRKKFGEVYDKYSEKVNSFIPFGSEFIAPKLPFSVRNVLKREYNSFVNIFLIFSALDLFRNYFLTGRIFFTRIWFFLLIGAAIIWLIIRSIHKLTRWLEVEGR